MEAYRITSNNLPITDQLCKTLENSQLLNIQDNCIFSQIAKYFILKSGYNIEDTYVLIHYRGGDFNQRNNKNDVIFINNDSEIINPLMENIITLNDDDTIHFYNKNELIINKTKKGECFFINYKTTTMSYHASRYTSMLRFYYYLNKPNLKHVHKSENTEFVNMQISPLQEYNFVFLDEPIIFVNNIYDRKSVFDYMNKYKNLSNEKRKIVIEVKKEIVKTDIYNCNKNYTENSLDYINLHGIKNFYNYQNISFVFDNKQDQEYIKNIFLNIKNKTRYHNDFSFKQPSIYFINKINQNKEELLITKIVNKFFNSELNTEFDSSKHDITINFNSDVYNPFEIDLIYTIFIVFEETNENEIIILQDNVEQYLTSNHILFIKPSPMNAIGFQKHHMVENKLESKKFIEISIFNHITSNKYIKFIENVENKPYLYKNPSIIKNSDLNFIFKFKNNSSKIISTKNKDVFTVENIKKIYKKFTFDNNTLHFFYKPNIILVNENILSYKHDEIYGVKTTYIHPNFKPMFTDIEKYCKNDIENIDNKHDIFLPIIYIFNNIVTKALDSVFNKEYIFNICNCSIIANNTEILKEFDWSYCDIQDNKNDALIVYVDICIDTNSDYFSKLDIYTNYVNFSNNLKNILRFTLEVENKNVIIT